MSCFLYGVFPEVQTAIEHATWIPGAKLAKESAGECYCDVAVHVYVS